MVFNAQKRVKLQKKSKIFHLFFLSSDREYESFILKLTLKKIPDGNRSSKSSFPVEIIWKFLKIFSDVNLQK